MGSSEAEELTRRLFEVMPGGVVHVRADGSIARANAEALRILGMSYDAATARYTQDWAGETLREDGTPCPVSDYPVTRALTSGDAQPAMTIGIRQPSGEIRWAVFTAIGVRAGEQVTGAVVTFLDVTAQRESEGRLRSLLESAPNYIVSSDREGRCTYVNRIAAGLDRAHLIGRYVWELVSSPDDGVRIRAAFEQIMSTGAAVEYEIGGTADRRYHVGAGPIRVGEETVGVTFNAFDITRHRELEAKIAQSDRLATIGTLAAGVAHEVNNPLTYLLANLEWLARAGGAASPERARNALAAAIEGATRIRDVVRDLGSMARVDAGRIAPLDLHALLDTALRMADHEIRVRARVRRAYGEVPRVVANESRLGQVLLNLVINAAQAIAEGDVDHHEIVVATRTEAERAVVEISDTGVGIAPEMLAKIFEPFVTTKPTGMGTGLGLHIARSIVESLGGEITVRSVVGAGTTVRVVLPPAPPNLAVELPPAPVTPPIAGRLRFLVIDDEPQVTRILEELLADHDVTTVNSGRAALPLLAANDYDVVLCDLVMPEMTGMEVFDAVEPRIATRIVFMTGGAFTDRARDFLATCPNDVLAKPFSAVELRDAIARAATR